MARRSLVFDIVVTVAMLTVLALLVAKVDGLRDTAVSGSVRVVDGDTLAFGVSRVRLAGIDAPETGQTCGADGATWDCGSEARAFLRDLIGDRDVTCTGRSTDRFGRLLALCSTDRGILNARMVSAGRAVAFGDYETEEALARDHRRGLWAGPFDRPRDWRRAHGQATEPPHMTADIIQALRRRIEALWTSP